MSDRRSPCAAEAEVDRLRAEVASLRGVIAARDLAIERLQQDVERWMDQASKWLVYRDALDAASERYCTFCEIERLRAAYDNDVEERQQWQEKCETLEVEIEQLRALLREATQDPERVEVNGVRQWELMVSDQWMQAARAAGAGDE